MDGRPSVDGSIEEWGERLTPVDDASVSVAAHPTDSLLYVALLVQDRALVRSLAVNGLVVWVDPSGGQRRAYGVQYPLGLRRQRAGQQAAAPEQGPASEQSAVGLDDVSLAELEVVRGDTARRRIPARFSSGLRGKAVLDPSSLIYEVAIPIGASSDGSRAHGLRTALSGPVGLGLEIPEPEEEEEETTANQGGNIGSVTGRRGRRRRRRQRRRRQQRQQQSGPQFATLDLWMTVPAGAQP